MVREIFVNNEAIVVIVIDGESMAKTAKPHRFAPPPDRACLDDCATVRQRDGDQVYSSVLAVGERQRAHTGS